MVLPCLQLRVPAVRRLGWPVGNLQTEPQGSQANALQTKAKRMPLEEANTEKLLSSADSGDLVAAPMNRPTCL